MRAVPTGRFRTVMGRFPTGVPGGDHTIGIGAVTAAETREGNPLVWYRGRCEELA